MRGYYLFGGEPLVRKDIGDIVRYAKNKRLPDRDEYKTVPLFGPGNRTSMGEPDFAFISLDYFKLVSRFHKG